MVDMVMEKRDIDVGETSSGKVFFRDLSNPLKALIIISTIASAWFIITLIAAIIVGVAG